MASLNWIKTGFNKAIDKQCKLTFTHIIFHNDSVIRISSHRGAECNIKGVNITHAFLDNVDFYEPSAYDVLCSIVPIISNNHGQLIVGSTGEIYDN